MPVSSDVTVTTVPPTGAGAGSVTSSAACRPTPTSGVPTSAIEMTLVVAVIVIVSGALSTNPSLTTRRTA